MSGPAYRIEWRMPSGDWTCPCGMRAMPRGYADGYLAARRDEPGPRLACRLVRETDGKVVEEIAAAEDVDVGMVAGWPTWQQYAEAAKRALVLAARQAMRADDAAVDTAGRLVGAVITVDDMVGPRVQP